MTSKKEVQIRIESISPDQNMVQSVAGDLYIKDETLYLRYLEPDPSMGKTMTTVKVAEDQIKVIRHGSLQSEQVFTKQKKQWGYYQTGQGRLQLQTRTYSIQDNLIEGIGSISWSYGLTVAGEYAGKFELKLNIQEGHK